MNRLVEREQELNYHIETSSAVQKVFRNNNWSGVFSQPRN